MRGQHKDGKEINEVGLHSGTKTVEDVINTKTIPGADCSYDHELLNT